MGIITSYAKGANEPDPVTGLTPKEKTLVTSSWNIVKKDLQGNGIELFKLFFKKKPEYQNYFSFKDVKIEDLYSNPKLKAHAIRVMYAIAYLIDSLDDSTVLVEMLKNNGESHRKKKIPVESFDVLKVALLELLEKSLGSKITKEGLDAWDKTLSVAFKVITGIMKEPATTA